VVLGVKAACDDDNDGFDDKTELETCGVDMTVGADDAFDVFRSQGIFRKRYVIHTFLMRFFDMFFLTCDRIRFDT